MTQEEYEKHLKTQDCTKCHAWSGTDCTRNPYEKECLDPVIQAYLDSYTEETK